MTATIGIFFFIIFVGLIIGGISITFSKERSSFNGYNLNNNSMDESLKEMKRMQEFEFLRDLNKFDGKWQITLQKEIN